MFAIYISSEFDKLTIKNLIEQYLYSRYSLPNEIIHSIEIAFPTYNKHSYIVVLNIEPEMVPEFNQQLYLGVMICEGLVCQHINVY